MKNLISSSECGLRLYGFNKLSGNADAPTPWTTHTEVEGFSLAVVGRSVIQQVKFPPFLCMPCLYLYCVRSLDFDQQL